jgi:hypothetical protein
MSAADAGGAVMTGENSTPASLPTYSADELLNVDDVATVLAFLALSRPLEGTSYDEDERFEHGRELLLRWLEASSVGADGAPASSTISQRDLLYECAQVLYFLQNLEPWSSGLEDDRRDKAEMGRFRVLEWLERRLLRASGYSASRPHATTAEKIEAVYEARDAIEERSQGGIPLN